MLTSSLTCWHNLPKVVLSYLNMVWVFDDKCKIKTPVLKADTMDWMWSQQNSYVKALTPNTTEFEDEALLKAIKVKCSHKGEVLLQKDCWYFEKRKRHQSSVSAVRGHNEKGVGRELHWEWNQPTPWSYTFRL